MIDFIEVTYIAVKLSKLLVFRIFFSILISIYSQVSTNTTMNNQNLIDFVYCAKWIKYRLFIQKSILNKKKLQLHENSHWNDVDSFSFGRRFHVVKMELISTTTNHQCQQNEMSMRERCVFNCSSTQNTIQSKLQT